MDDEELRRRFGEVQDAITAVDAKLHVVVFLVSAIAGVAGVWLLPKVLERWW